MKESTYLFKKKKFIYKVTRDPEVRGVKQFLIEFNKLSQVSLKIIEMKSPACLDGGDVLVTKNEIFVGESTRTNKEGLFFFFS